MNKRLRILVLCVCGSVGVAIALAVAWRPKAPLAADPNMAVLPTGDFSTSMVSTPVATTPAPATPTVAISVSTVPVEAPTPAKVENSAPPAAPAPSPLAEESAENKSLQRLKTTIEDFQDENLRQQRKVREDVLELRGEIQRTAARPARAADADQAADEKEELPPQSGTPNPIRSEGDGQLSFDWPDNTDIRQALKLLNEQGLNILVSKNVTGTVSASLTKVDAETALAAVLKNAGLCVCSAAAMAAAVTTMPPLRQAVFAATMPAYAPSQSAHCQADD